MLVTGKIVDLETGEPVEGASVIVVDSAGNGYGEGIAADDNGGFALDSSLLSPFGGFGLLISSVGYQPVIVDPSYFINEYEYGLIHSDKELPAVVVSPEASVNPWVLLIGGAATVWLLSGSKKKVSGVLDDNKVLYAGLGIAALSLVYIGVVNPILKKVGIKDSDETKELDQAATSGESFWSQNFYLNGPANQRILPYETAKAYVNEIQNAFGVFSDDEDKVIGIFKTMESQSQVSYLAYVFYALTGKDLLSYLRGGVWPADRLSDADVAIINRFVSSLPKY